MKEAINASFMIHEDSIMITKKGELIVIASAVFDQIDLNMTIFSKVENRESDKVK